MSICMNRRWRRDGMKVIGLTGGFLSGKSTVLRLFAQCGAEVLDADRLYHELLERDARLCRELEAEFGSDICDDRGTVDRTRLRELVCADRKLMDRLSGITLPYILDELRKRIRAMREGAGIAVVEVPLLFEKRMEHDFDAVLVVDADDTIRRERALGRGYDERFFAAVEQAQLPLREKVERADYVIINNGDREHLKKQVQVVYGEIGENVTERE